MSLEAALRQEARRAEFVARMAERIAGHIAGAVDHGGFLDSTDEELGALVEASVMTTVRELGDDIRMEAAAVAKIGGLEELTAAEIEAVVEDSASDAEVQLLDDLRGVRRRFLKDAQTAEGVPAGLADALRKAIEGTLAGGLRSLTADIFGDLNRAAALKTGKAKAGSGKLEGKALSEPRLTWATMRNRSVCHDEDSGSAVTADGVELKPGSAGSCQARHGAYLTLSDWMHLGLPRDARLLCCRFGRRRCRCRLLGKGVSFPGSPLDTGADIAAGREAADAEELSFDGDFPDWIRRRKLG